VSAFCKISANFLRIPSSCDFPCSSNIVVDIVGVWSFSGEQVYHSEALWWWRCWECNCVLWRTLLHCHKQLSPHLLLFCCCLPMFISACVCLYICWWDNWSILVTAFIKFSGWIDLDAGIFFCV